MKRLLEWLGLGTKAANNSERGWVTFAGQTIYDEMLDEKSALTIGTYYSCIRNIAEDTAKLPFRLLKNTKKKRVSLEKDPLANVLAVTPNPLMSAFTFRSTMMQWAAGWGNAYAEIVRNGAGQIAGLYPIHPSRVRVERLSGSRFVYKIHNDDGSTTSLPRERIFHLYGMSSDGLMGYSVARLMSNTLKLAGNAQNFASNFLQNSARPAGVLETPQILKPENKQALGEAWMRMYAGPMNAGKTAILDGGVVYKGLTMPMKDMEFLELRRFQKEEIASWFRMPLYKIQDVGRAQGWSTLDAQETDYVNSCLMPWLVRFEQEVKRQLMTGYDAAIYPHCEVKGLLRGDVKTRTEFCRAMHAAGAMTSNEWRKYEDMEPHPDPAADRLYIQGAMVPLEKAGQVEQAAMPQEQNNG